MHLLLRMLLTLQAVSTLEYMKEIRVCIKPRRSRELTRRRYVTLNTMSCVYCNNASLYAYYTISSPSSRLICYRTSAVYAGSINPHETPRPPYLSFTGKALLCSDCRCSFRIVDLGDLYEREASTDTDSSSDVFPPVTMSSATRRNISVGGAVLHGGSGAVAKFPGPSFSLLSA
ncbi:hypothetical protein EDB87DRAFT_301228 [Lactarius vividus]|nr:hypothetical protein EDB87DRAFT_301228 [Lactarius vividus]